MAGKFVVLKGKNGRESFILKAGNGREIGGSPMSTSSGGCRNGMLSVARNAADARAVGE